MGVDAGLCLCRLLSRLHCAYLLHQDLGMCERMMALLGKVCGSGMCHSSWTF